MKLLELARTGFPTHTSLREAFVHCDEKYGIFESTGRGRHDLANDAADVWRKMCRDVYNMAKSKVFPSDLGDVVAIVDLSHRIGAEEDGKSSEVGSCKNTSNTVATETSTEVAKKTGTEVVKMTGRKIATMTGNESEGTKTTYNEVAETGMELALPDFAEFTDEEAEPRESCMTVDDSDVEITSMRCSCPQCNLPVPSAAAGGQKAASKGVMKKAEGEGERSQAPYGEDDSGHAVGREGRQEQHEAEEEEEKQEERGFVF